MQSIFFRNFRFWFVQCHGDLRRTITGSNWSRCGVSCTPIQQSVCFSCQTVGRHLIFPLFLTHPPASSLFRRLVQKPLVGDCNILLYRHDRFVHILVVVLCRNLDYWKITQCLTPWGRFYAVLCILYSVMSYQDNSDRRHRYKRQSKVKTWYPFILVQNAVIYPEK